MPTYFYTFLLSIIFMFLFVPISIKIGYKYNILDRVEPKAKAINEVDSSRKKIHSKITPRTGGIALFISFWSAIFITIGSSKQILGIFIGSLFLFSFMLYDDRYNLSPKFKLLIQIISACIPIFFGVKINFFSNILTKEYYAIGFWGIPLTIAWCVALVNAMNLIDGLDGLASGIAAIASLGIVFISLSRGLMVATTFGISIVAICLVFLRYNFYPSKIILGDNGAQFLGYIVAMIAVLGGLKTSTSVIIVASALAFGLPIFDIFFSIMTRIKKKTPIYQADLENIHYQLYKRGWSQRRIAILFYLVTVLLFIIPYLIFFNK